MTYTQLISMYSHRANDEVITYIAGTATRSYSFRGKHVVVENIDDYIQDPLKAKGVKIRVETENGPEEFLKVFTILDFFSMADEINSKKSNREPERDTIMHEFETLLRHADEVVIREIMERPTSIFLPELGGTLDYDQCHNVVLVGGDGPVPIRRIMSDRDYIEKIADRVKFIGAYQLQRADITESARVAIEKSIAAGRLDVMSTFIHVVTGKPLEQESGQILEEAVKNFVETAPAVQVETVAKYCEVNLEPVM